MIRCQVCGCSELDPCVDEFDDEPHPCAWIAPGLCSACRYTPLACSAPTLEERLPNYVGVELLESGELTYASDYL